MGGRSKRRGPLAGAHSQKLPLSAAVQLNRERLHKGPLEQAAQETDRAFGRLRTGELDFDAQVARRVIVGGASVRVGGGVGLDAAGGVFRRSERQLSGGSVSLAKGGEKLRVRDYKPQLYVYRSKFGRREEGGTGRGRGV